MKVLIAPTCTAIAMIIGWFVYEQSLSDTQTTPKTIITQPIAVQVTRSTEKSLVKRINLVGNLEAGSQVEIRTRYSGYIKSMPFNVGDQIKAGEVILELNDSENQELVSKSKAALTVAKAQLKAQETSEELAQKAFQRLELLQKSGVSTNQQLEEAVANVTIAKAQTRLENARVEQAESDLKQSSLRLQENKILAPINGFLAERLVDIGDLAKPDVALMKIVNLDHVRTIVHIVEKDYEDVKKGQKANITVDTFPGKTFSGHVIRKAPVLDPETRTAAVYIEFPNSDYSLKPGMHARVQIVFEQREKANVLSVASLTRRKDGPGSAVFVIVGDPPITERRNIEIGINDGELVEILSGINSKDLVITLGNRLVDEGQKVTPIEVPMEEVLETPLPPIPQKTNL
ncbi:MAG: efflux RND transporter periplasmic adaptor subunit [Planctomycetes bacterium]|nr:efflux RND transporter periplasmic adaptor subunit [Planctomycetota bacterium]MCH9727269.1 efflux RND transporter periplasmic adaptor subunit [Planctomycetota bacterium]MCH9776764.1 efflux RND transporter periplasmic adaptor subunit [Planctomycetota bacterium]MCH9789374.1 efflux RND transporter periplasmic adaptor subunit [Planctomycetota bacterium]MDF1743033.1 efflux RND transporter periplasmic adaptor subunit [Gimesia sp.]